MNLAKFAKEISKRWENSVKMHVLVHINEFISHQKKTSSLNFFQSNFLTNLLVTFRYCYCLKLMYLVPSISLIFSDFYIIGEYAKFTFGSHFTFRFRWDCGSRRSLTLAEMTILFPLN